MSYRIIGIKLNGDGFVEVYRSTLDAAKLARDLILELGYVAEVRPTAEVWTQELELS